MPTSGNVRLKSRRVPPPHGLRLPVIWMAIFRFKKDLRIRLTPKGPKYQARRSRRSRACRNNKSKLPVSLKISCETARGSPRQASARCSYVLCDLTDPSWPQHVGPFDLAVSAIALHNWRRSLNLQVSPASRRASGSAAPLQGTRLDRVLERSAFGAGAAIFTLQSVIPFRLGVGVVD